MVNYLCVSDRPYKIPIQVLGFYMPVTCTILDPKRGGLSRGAGRVDETSDLV